MRFQNRDVRLFVRSFEFFSCLVDCLDGVDEVDLRDSVRRYQSLGVLGDYTNNSHLDAVDIVRGVSGERRFVGSLLHNVGTQVLELGVTASDVVVSAVEFVVTYSRSVKAQFVEVLKGGVVLLRGGCVGGCTNVVTSRQERGGFLAVVRDSGGEVCTHTRPDSSVEVGDVQNLEFGALVGYTERRERSKWRHDSES